MQAGMFVYADGRVSYDLHPGERSGANEVVAIFIGANVRTRRALCMTLEEVLLPWSSDEIDVVQGNAFASGAEFTQQILKAADPKHHAEAAYFCSNYSHSVIKSGMAFLPTVRDVLALESSVRVINIALERLNLSGLFEDGPIWTAEAENYEAKLVMYGRVIPERKLFKHSVRPFVEFEF